MAVPDIPTALAKLTENADASIPAGMTAENATLLAIMSAAARAGDAVAAARIGAAVCFTDLARISEEAAGDPKKEMQLLKIAEKRQTLHNRAVKNLQESVEREQRLLERPNRQAPVTVNTTAPVQVNAAPEPSPRVQSWIERTNDLRLSKGQAQ